MKKKAIVIIVIILVIILIAFSIIFKYINLYYIDDSKRKIQESIIQRLSTHSDNTDSVGDIKIAQSLDIYNKKLIIFTYGNYTGYTEFTKGYNNKYKIGNIKYSSNSIVLYQIKKIKNKKYFVIGGKNSQLIANYAKVLLEMQIYKISIPQQEYFIAYCEVPHSTNLQVPEISSISFYNKNGINVTNKVISK